MVDFDQLVVSIKSLIGASFSDFKQNRNWLKMMGGLFSMFLPALPCVLVEVALLQLTIALSPANSNEVGPIGWVTFPLMFCAHIALFVAVLSCQMGFLRLSLKLGRNERTAVFKEVMAGRHLLKNMLLCALVVAPAVVLGTLCLIIPGVYIAIRMSFAMLAVADGAGPIEAVKKSWSMTRGHMLEIIGLYFVYQLASYALIFLPFINIFILVFFAGPFINFFWAKYYLYLNGEAAPQTSTIAAPAAA